MASTLAIDIGGTKILSALVHGRNVVSSQLVATDRLGGPEEWVAQAADMARNWKGQYERCGVTVSGVVHDGLWSAMNPATLNVPNRFPLAKHVSEVFGLVPTLCNDAQAAAWGEYHFGAGNGQDTVFVTVSTGIGGGVVVNGQLLQGKSGMSGHFGLLLNENGSQLEDVASGRWIASEAKKRGHPAEARDVFAASSNGDLWADELINESATQIARLCSNLQLLFDPHAIVLGGGVGLAPGYLTRVKSNLENQLAHVSPNLASAALGVNAGVLGIAALADFYSARETNK